LSGGKRLEVTVKVNAKKNGKAIKTKKLSLKVKVVNASLTASATTTSIAVGQTTAISTKSVPAAAVVSYSSSDEKVATVSDAGVVTGVAAGTATITATSDYGKSATVDVTVATVVLKDATQTEYNKIVATIVGDTSSLKAGDFAITNTSTKATVAVKSVTAVKNTTDKFTIETFTGMTDAKTYTVAYGGVEVSFTATDGTVASVGLSLTEVPAATKTEVQLTSLDANGIVLKYFDLHTNSTGKGDVTSKTTFTKGYIDGNIVYLPSVGDTISVAVTYHTGTFATDGTETGNIEGTFTITAVDPSTLNYNYAVTISDSAAGQAWTADSFVANTNVKLGATRYASFYITDENKKEVDCTQYYVESADKTKLIVTGQNLVASQYGSQGVTIEGVSEGTSYILIKKDDVNGAVVASLPVTIVAAPVATTLELSKDSVTISKSATANTVEEKVKVTVKDQYGDEVKSGINTPTVEVLSKPSKDAVAAASDITATAKDITVDADDFTSKDAGTYTYKLTYPVTVSNVAKSLTRSFSVIVAKNSDTTTYAMELDQSSVDTTVTADTDPTDLGTDIGIKVAIMNNGGVQSYVTSTVAYTVKNSSGVQVNAAAYDANYTNYFDTTTTTGALTVSPLSVTGTTFDKNLAAGTYTVTATFTGADSKQVTVNGSFTITDTQDKKASFDIVDNDLGNSLTVADAFVSTNTNSAGSKYVKVYYDGLEKIISAGDVSKVTGVTQPNGGAYVKTVKLYVTLSDATSYKVPVTLTVNDQFASCNGLE
jgi:hypothetical protein